MSLKIASLKTASLSEAIVGATTNIILTDPNWLGAGFLGADDFFNALLSYSSVPDANDAPLTAPVKKQRELVRVTAITNTGVTVLRAQEGTAALTWPKPAGTEISLSMIVTAADMKLLQGELNMKISGVEGSEIGTDDGPVDNMRSKKVRVSGADGLEVENPANILHKAKLGFVGDGERTIALPNKDGTVALIEDLTQEHRGNTAIIPAHVGDYKINNNGAQYDPLRANNPVVGNEEKGDAVAILRYSASGVVLVAAELPHLSAVFGGDALVVGDNDARTIPYNAILQGAAAVPNITIQSIKVGNNSGVYTASFDTPAGVSAIQFYAVLLGVTTELPFTPVGAIFAPVGAFGNLHAERTNLFSNNAAAPDDDDIYGKPEGHVWRNGCDEYTLIIAATVAPALVGLPEWRQTRGVKKIWDRATSVALTLDFKDGVSGDRYLWADFYQLQIVFDRLVGGASVEEESPVVAFAKPFIDGIPIRATAPQGPSEVTTITRTAASTFGLATQNHAPRLDKIYAGF